MQVSIAQQEWIHTQQAFSLYDVNAAAVGDGARQAIAIRYRNQWTGVEGAPESMQFSYQSPYSQRNIALGTQVFRESIGAHSNTSLQATVGYRLKLNTRSRIHFALEGGVLNMGFDQAKLIAQQVNDPSLSKPDQSNWSPILNAAIFWRNERMYAGMEANRLIESNTGVTENYRQSMHLNLIAGHVFKLGRAGILKPMAIIRMNEGSTQWEAQTAIFLNGQLWLGTGYRQHFGFLGFLEYQFSPRLRLGYSIDLPTEIEIAPGMTHELFLGIQWAHRNDRGPSIRYFQ